MTIPMPAACGLVVKNAEDLSISSWAAPRPVSLTENWSDRSWQVRLHRSFRLSPFMASMALRHEVA